jgi:putative transposase
MQQEFPELRKRYWGRGYFSATSRNITDDMIDEYINSHYDAHKDNDESLGYAKDLE